MAVEEVVRQVLVDEHASKRTGRRPTPTGAT